jgi:hypothetical protein
VFLSGYANFVAPVLVRGNDGRPHWIAEIDFGELKLPIIDIAHRPRRREPVVVVPCLRVSESTVLAGTATEPPNGRVGSAAVIRSSGFAELDRAAHDILRSISPPPLLFCEHDNPLPLRGEAMLGHLSVNYVRTGAADASSEGDRNWRTSPPSAEDRFLALTARS